VLVVVVVLGPPGGKATEHDDGDHEDKNEVSGDIKLNGYPP
jgi:hypothetical protein